MTTTAAPPNTIAAHAGLRMELDCTPRWFASNVPGFWDDCADIMRALGAYEGPLARCVVDCQVGVSGVRVVVAVPAGPSTNAFEDERRAIVATLDGLDGYHPRRARVTAARVAQRAKDDAARAEAAAHDAAAVPAVDATADEPREVVA